jgi:hypothetical protein
MFRNWDWTFSSTAELATAIMLAVLVLMLAAVIV